MAQTIIANLPTIDTVQPYDYVIVERPEIGDGTFKARVENLQPGIIITDEVPVPDSTNFVTSGAVYAAIHERDEIISALERRLAELESRLQS